MPPLSRCRLTRTAASLSVAQPRRQRRASSRSWCLSSGPLKTGVTCASSQDAIKQKLRGVKHELQANCQEEVRNGCTLMEKPGGQRQLSLEGKPSRALCSPCLQSLQPRTCPQRSQAARSQPELRGWRESSTGRVIPSPQLANTPCAAWTLLLPHTWWLRSFQPTCDLLALELKQTTCPRRHSSGRVCACCADTPTCH